MQRRETGFALPIGLALMAGALLLVLAWPLLQSLTSDARDWVSRVAEDVNTRTVGPGESAQAAANEVSQNAERVYGPAEGQLVHATDGFLKTHRASISARDFVAEVRFHNPYSTTEGSWDYGMLFRDTGANLQYRLGVSSDMQFWALDFHDGPGGYVTRQEGKLEHLNRTEEGYNGIKLIVKDGTGFFFLNDKYVATLDVSAKRRPGDVSVAINMYEGNAIADKSTRYDGFTVSILAITAEEHVLVARANNARGELDRALERATLAIGMNPNYPEAHEALGVSLRRLGRNEEALAAHERALELRPNYPEALYGRGIALANLRRDEEAIIAYGQAIELRASYPEAYLAQGSALWRLGRNDDALQANDQALALRPGWDAPLNNRALVLVAMARGEDALTDANRAVELGRTSTHLDTRGYVFLKMQQYDKALADYEEAIRLQTVPRAFYLLGRGLALTNLERPGARQDLEEGLRLASTLPIDPQLADLVALAHQALDIVP
ncbi:MAG TPA: tetratricopeptide repeat protein [Dehalococcoidia bacterium]|nr:tetratricopeptide repeat protein [Dehalococcoidia bacterium]